MKTSLPETDYYGVASLTYYETHFLNESEKRIGVFAYRPPPCFGHNVDVLLSNPVPLQLQSDCRDGADKRLVMKGRVHPITSPDAPSWYHNMRDGISMRFFSSLSSPPLIPSLSLFNAFQQWSKARALTSCIQKCNMLHQKMVWRGVTPFSYLIFKLYHLPSCMYTKV